MIKKIMLGFALLLLVLAAGGYFVWSQLDRIIQASVEKYGTAATQAQVTLNHVHLSLTSGEGSLSGLSVGNPRGFSPAKSMVLGSIAVQVETGSLRGNGPIVIDKMVVDGPQVTYELTNSGSSNMQAIQKNTQTYANAMSGKSANANAAAAGADSKSARKIVINDLVIRNGEVAISQQELQKLAGQNKPLSTQLPVIHLTNIGKASGGATAAQVAQQVLGSIANSASKAAVVTLAKAKLSGALKATPVSVIGGAAADTVGGEAKDILGQ